MESRTVDGLRTLAKNPGVSIEDLTVWRQKAMLLSALGGSMPDDLSDTHGLRMCRLYAMQATQGKAEAAEVFLHMLNESIVESGIFRRS